MQENTLNDITEDILQDIGIAAVGDILLILRHAKRWVCLFSPPENRTLARFSFATFFFSFASH